MTLMSKFLSNNGMLIIILSHIIIVQLVHILYPLIKYKKKIKKLSIIHQTLFFKKTLVNVYTIYYKRSPRAG